MSVLYEIIQDTDVPRCALVRLDAGKVACHPDDVQWVVDYLRVRKCNYIVLPTLCTANQPHEAT